MTVATYTCVRSCHRCDAPADRVRLHPLYGRRTYCDACLPTAGDTEDAIVRDMAMGLMRAFDVGEVDLVDRRSVSAWLLARHWSADAIDALGKAAADRAWLRLHARRLFARPAKRVIDAIAVFGAAAVWGLACCVAWPGNARAGAAATASPEGMGFVADLVPVVAALLLVLIIVFPFTRRGQPIQHQDDGDGDTTGWGEL